MNPEKKLLIVIDQNVYHHVERPVMQAITEEVTGYINSLGDARTAVISVSFQPGLTVRLQKLLKVTVTLGGTLLKEPGDVLAYTSSINLDSESTTNLPEKARGVIATSLEAARAIRNHVIIEGIPVVRELPDTQGGTIEHDYICPKCNAQMTDDGPHKKCHNCGHSTQYC